MHLILSLTLLNGLLTIILRPPPSTSLVGINISCENGLETESIRQVERSTVVFEVKARFGGTCNLIAVAFDTNNKIVKRETREFFAS